MMNARALHALLALPLTGLLLSACGEEDDPNTDPNNETKLTVIRSATLSGDGAGGAPDATGTVALARDPDGALYITLGDNFMQEMGPGDTQLFIAKASGNIDAQMSAAPSSVALIGTISNGFSGAKNFAVPAGTDVDALPFAIVWCPTAGVVFGTAELDPASGPSPEVVRSASFVADGAGGAPDATGTVRVLREGSNLSIVLGEDFSQEMGPGDTQLFLARGNGSITEQMGADPSSVSPVLGTLGNGTSGMHSFDLGSTVDLDAYDYVVVWCPTAGVVFGAAELPHRSGNLMADGSGGAPDATGMIGFARNESGKLVLELGADFMQEMGPGDTQLFLTRGTGSITEQRDAGAENVSAVIGTISNGGSGAMSFEIPSSVNADLYDHAIVWCPTAGVSFGVADLR